MEITLPSGLTGSIRKLKVSEEDILADRQLVRSGLLNDELLKACWTGTSNPGPYAITDGHPTWANVLIGDRFSAIVQLRIMSYGDRYEFSTPCQSCREKIGWGVNLSELPTKIMTDEQRALFVNGNRFKGRTASGVEYAYRLLVGTDEQRIPKLRQEYGKQLSSMYMRLRLIEVIGQQSVNLNRWIRDLDVDVAADIREEMDRNDVGIETGIEIECACGNRQEVDLPFDRGFFRRTKPLTGSGQN